MQWDVAWSTEDPRFGGCGTTGMDLSGQLAHSGPCGRRPEAGSGDQATIGRPAARKGGARTEYQSTRKQGREAVIRPNTRMDDLVRKMPWPGEDPESEPLLSREWLVTNGLGGYASGTVNGIITRGFHGYLIAALPSPLGRMMMFNDLVEKLEFPNGNVVQLGGEERSDIPLQLHGADFLSEFRMDLGLPVWLYQVGGVSLEKRLVMPHGQNTVYVKYRILSGDGSVRLSLRPSLHFRPHNDPVSEHIDTRYSLTVYQEDQYEVASESEVPPLRFLLYGENPALSVDRQTIEEVVYRIEASRGYSSRGDLWSPGWFQLTLSKGHSGSLVASTEKWEIIRAMESGGCL